MIVYKPFKDLFFNLFNINLKFMQQQLFTVGSIPSVQNKVVSGKIAPATFSSLPIRAPIMKASVSGNE